MEILVKEDPLACPSAFWGVDDLKNGRKSFFSHHFEARQSFRLNLGFQRKKACFTSKCVRSAAISVHMDVEISFWFVVFQSSWGRCMTDLHLTSFTFQHVALNSKNANDAKKVAWHHLQASSRGNISTRDATMLRIWALKSWCQRSSPRLQGTHISGGNRLHGCIAASDDDKSCCATWMKT